MKSLLPMLLLAAVFAIVVAAPVISTDANRADALPEPGSRVCGYWVRVNPGPGIVKVIAILYEARNADATYHQQCVEAMNGVKDAIQSSPELSQFPVAKEDDIPFDQRPNEWTMIDGGACEWIGQHFTTPDHPSDDMCDYMEAKESYMITHDRTTNPWTVTYDKK